MLKLYNNNLVHYISLKFKINQMKRIFACFLAICISANVFSQNTDSLVFRNIFDETMLHGEAYDWLHDLCKDVGHRLSGSPQADMAVRWGRG